MVLKVLPTKWQCQHHLLDMRILKFYPGGPESESLGVDPLMHALASHLGGCDVHKV